MTTRQQMLAMTAAAALLAVPALALAQGSTPGANNNATVGTLAQTAPTNPTPAVPNLTTPAPRAPAPSVAAPSPMTPGTTANTAPGMGAGTPPGLVPGTTPNASAPDGTPGNPPGTAAGRAADRALGTNSTGANPAAAPDGTPGNPPGTAAGRAVDRALGTNTTGANPAADRAPAASTAGAATGPLAVDSSTLQNGRRASKLIGSAVYNENNESIGEVDDILIPAGGTGPVAVISVGGFLGIGAKLVAVPYNRLSMAANSNGRWTLTGATKDSLGSLPTFTYEAAAERRG